MPSSLRFALFLFVVAAVAGIASTIVLYWQDDAQARITAEQIAGGNVDAGKVALGRYGCGACHEIPGFEGAQGRVGPSLKSVATRAEIAGVLPNTPPNMVRWIRTPQQVVPGNGMPDQGVGERDARDMAAYLYTLKR